MRRTVTSEWIEQVRQALKERGLSQRKLAAMIGKTDAQVSLIMRGKIEATVDVEPISEILAITLPPLKPYAPLVQRLADVAQDLDSDELEILLAMAEKLGKTSR